MGLELRPAARHHSLGEELANAATHGAGAVLALFGLGFLVARAADSGSTHNIVGATVYGVTLLAVYLSSTLHHGARHQRPKQIFLMLDHCAIFLLIAGTNTPFALVVLEPATGNTLLAGVWVLAAVGICVILVSFITPMVDRYDKALTVLYVATAWFGIIWAGDALYDALPAPAFAWLIGGTAVITLGVPFYQWRLMPFSHAVWHLFTLAGSGAHFWAIYHWVAPAAAA